MFEVMILMMWGFEKRVGVFEVVAVVEGRLGAQCSLGWWWLGGWSDGGGWEVGAEVVVVVGW